MKCAIFALLALPLLAQSQPPQQPIPQVREYLQLTSTQVAGIALNNEEYNRSMRERVARIRQVQGELALETVREPLDSNALGVRYTEIELICRDLRDLANSLQKQNMALLTDEQRAKLKTLEEALKLLSVANEAQLSNLLIAWPTGPSLLISNNASINVSFGTNAIPGCAGTGLLTIR